MSKVTILQTNQYLMSLLLRIDVKQNENPSIRTGFFPSIRVPLILFSLFNLMLSNAVKVLNNSYDFTIRLLAALIIIAVFPAVTMILDIGLQTEKLAALYQTFQAIVDNEGVPFLLESLKNKCFILIINQN